MRISVPPYLHAREPCPLSFLQALGSAHLCSKRVKSLRRRLPFLLLVALACCTLAFPSSRDPSLTTATHARYQAAAAGKMAPRQLTPAESSLAEQSTPTSPIIRDSSLSTDSSRPITPELATDSSADDDDAYSSSEDDEVPTPDKERRPLMLLPQLRRTPKYQNLRQVARRSEPLPPAPPSLPPMSSPLSDIGDPLDKVDTPECPMSPLARWDDFPSEDGLVLIQLPCHIRISGFMSTAADGGEDKALVQTSFEDIIDDAAEPRQRRGFCSPMVILGLVVLAVFILILVVPLPEEVEHL
ncbi:hypothetical protein CALCODRAFT_502663 [Calocera cornea HHB12733]|uniref:Transmembrane protein n=1 Tax=Calocera cornea HHB12733 TaxID=1353952 RepID=A0A165D5V7_9BASI|nr:hypothetical protein CALCODRAFT_502663 [Calocera cornea HHB12733]